MNYIAITSPDINNGLGCRVTLWIAGCSNKCKGCQNKETWNYDQGKDIFDDELYTKICDELSKPYIKGLTLSGGDPLSQPLSNLYDLYRFVEKVKYDFPDKDIWIYTGDTYEEILNFTIKKLIVLACDVLVEGRYDMTQRDITLPFRGSKNQRIIDIKKSSKHGELMNKPIELVIPEF